MADDDRDVVNTSLVECPDDASDKVVEIVDAEKRLGLAFHAGGQTGGQNDGGDHATIVVASRTTTLARRATTPTTLPGPSIIRCQRCAPIWRCGILRREC